MPLPGSFPDLFLSALRMMCKERWIQALLQGIICDGGREYAQQENIRQIRIAFDEDAVLFTDESERIFQEKGSCCFEGK